jgi:SAM-dependent methyltransferase
VSLFRKWLGGEAARSAPPPPAPSRLLERLLRSVLPDDPDSEERPEIILLGPPRGHQIEFFTHQGCRVAVEDVSEFLEAAREAAGQEGSPPLALALDQPEARFQAAMLFDVIDRLDDAAVLVLLAEVGRVLAPGGYLLALSDSRPGGVPEPPREVVLAAGGYRFEETGGRPYRRKKRANRDLLRIFEGFNVQQLQLRTDGVREILVRSPVG